MNDLALAPITELASLIQSRQLSSLELTQQMLQRIADLDRRFHAYVTVTTDLALAQARAADAAIHAGNYRGPLHGIPIALKDLCYTKGIATTCGAQMFGDFVPEQDGTVTRKLADAGTVLLGKLHMTEFALRWHHPYRPIPVNPWGKGRWPGVSSSGSGVAVATGLCYGAIGTDTGGSIRFPAAANGVVGLKPTYGRVSRAGVFPLAGSLDNVGPLTRTVADAAIWLRAIAGHDPLDPTSSTLPVPDYPAELAKGLQGIRIGVDETYLTEGVQPAVAQAVLAAVDVLRELGAELVTVTVPEPNLDEMVKAWYLLTAADALVAHEGIYPQRRDEYGPFHELLDDGAKASAQDYAKAHQLREETAFRMTQLFDDIDVLITPTMPTTAPRMDASGAPLIQEGYVRARYTYPYNFSRHPTLSLPCGFDEERLPVSIQFVGRHFGEDLICRVGHVYEQATEWHKAVPTLLSNEQNG
ncbi:MAG: amidase [Caldilineaceae bacterium]|nr:amidase [Caldilineaceae bacterium]